MSAGITAITMPKWGIEMTEGSITAWNFAVGQHVNKGDGLLDVETEKIVNAVESPASGTLRRILAEAGDVRAVGSLIAVFADAAVTEAAIDDFIASFRGATLSFEPDAPAGAAAAATSPATASTSADGADTDGEQRISPIARRLAERLGIDLSQVRGTGRNGRISKEDVEAFAASQNAVAASSATAASATVSNATPAPTRTRLSPTRLTIARRLTESAQTIPHYRLSCDADVEALLKHKSAIAAQSGQRITVNDLLLRACALSLLEHPVVNSQLVGDELLQFSQADIAIAVATDNGLITPILRAANTKTVAQIAAESAELVARAQRGALSRDDISGGSFTISNLGMHGVDRFDAIINPPQVAILAVGSASERVVARGGVMQIARVLTLTLSADHRVIDGAVGAGFLATLRQRIENPAAL